MAEKATGKGQMPTSCEWLGMTKKRTASVLGCRDRAIAQVSMSAHRSSSSILLLSRAELEAASGPRACHASRLARPERLRSQRNRCNLQAAGKRKLLSLREPTFLQRHLLARKGQALLL